MSGPGPSGRRRRQHEEEEESGHENAERWLLSYADMITLLMALFIVLFAISQVDQAKLLALSSGLQQYFGAPAVTNHTQGVLDGTSTDSAIQAIAPVAPQVVSDVATSPTTTTTSAPCQPGDEKTKQAARDQLTAVRDRLVTALTAKGLQQAVHFELRDDGLVVDIVSDRVLFDPGQATLKPDGRRVLAAIAPTLRRLSNTMTVEGHTDDVPVVGLYPSNWELSTARSTSVLQYLLGQGVAGRQLGAAGYADQRPLASNATEAGRARNRRVAVVVHAAATTSPATTAGSATTVSTSSPGGSR
ncbi:flagellar motor protein MotB [Phycicoccus sp.]|uniref:flagellar motor protein MotB n=1 Tax=Phycicoccus sp. TaxID=1902410 RepID=UPI002C57D806|nr:flagellar motor protein MotB [Phycicoccus sp.]HMM96138.1 flagellar motor protein MotB [Phycicoccus sp.]